VKSDLELMRIHVETLFTHDHNARIRAVNEPDGDPAPRFYLGRTSEGNLWRFHFDLPDHLVEELKSLGSDEPVVDDLRLPPRYSDAYQRLLNVHAPIQRVWSGPAFRFPDMPPLRSRDSILISDKNAAVLSNGFEDWHSYVPYRQPFLAIVKGSRAVSVCCSVRVTSEAHEAGVETLKEFRGKGYAADVVAGWAGAVRRLDRIPMYSTSWENKASQGVARKLGLIAYGCDFHIT
jgi:RimJ/RimL family protein N-acetyltransferase